MLCNGRPSESVRARTHMYQILNYTFCQVDDRHLRAGVTGDKRPRITWLDQDILWCLGHIHGAIK
jgi:hypothetical protein